jgi:aspartate/methionine/tyrosine aminotransferase
MAPATLQRAGRLDPISATFGVHGRGTADGVLDVALGSLRGVPVLRGLWEGFRVDDECVDRLGAYPGTQGPVSLLAACSQLARRESGRRVAVDEIALTHGGLHGLGAAIAALPAGAPVIYPRPGFSYQAAIAWAKARPVAVDWPVQAPVAALLHEVDERLRDLPRPAGVIACFPSNPGGASPTDAEWRHLRQIVARHEAVLIADELYRFAEPRDLDLDGDDVIVVDSLSKRLGAPGLRLGWVTASGPRFAAVREAVAQTSVGVALPVAALAEHALRRYLGGSDVARRVRAALAARRDAIRAALPPGRAGDLVLSDSGFYACLMLGAADSAELAARLLRRGIAVTPSSAMYPPGVAHRPEFVRFCVGGDERVDEAVAAAAAELAPLRRVA